MNRPIHLVGISGSLRKGSYNTMLLNAATALLPEGVTVETVSIQDIPVYNADDDIPTSPKRPETVNAFINLTENCEFARYAPSSSGAIQQDYDKAVTVISELEKQI